MVPAAYVEVGAVAADGRTGSWIARPLPAPRRRSVRAEALRGPPVGEIEQALAQIWSELLGVEPVGRHDSFFELGGHSLLAVQLISRIRQRLGIELSLQGAVCPAGVEGKWPSRWRKPRPSTLGIIPVVDRNEPLPLSFAQERLWFIAQLDMRGQCGLSHCKWAQTAAGLWMKMALVRALDHPGAASRKHCATPLL